MSADSMAGLVYLIRRNTFKIISWEFLNDHVVCHVIEHYNLIEEHCTMYRSSSRGTLYTTLLKGQFKC